MLSVGHKNSDSQPNSDITGIVYAPVISIMITLLELRPLAEDKEVAFAAAQALRRQRFLEYMACYDLLLMQSNGLIKLEKMTVERKKNE
jgi:hypothetical protein